MDRKTFLKRGPLMLVNAFLEGARGETGAHRRRQEGSGAAPLLRPPGAASEAEFLELCCGVGACAEVCPARAIQIRPREDDPSRVAPLIIPHEAACVLCDELACMRACPSGALTELPRGEIRIGEARVDPDRCLAWAGIDPGCDYCVSRCPVAAEAIILVRENGQRGPRVLGGCTGCGQCEYFCPSSPKAIRVYPLGALSAG